MLRRHEGWGPSGPARHRPAVELDAKDFLQGADNSGLEFPKARGNSFRGGGTSRISKLIEAAAVAGQEQGSLAGFELDGLVEDCAGFDDPLAVTSSQ